MTRAEFDAWLNKYSVPLGLTRDEDLRMLDSWYADVFVPAGYTAAELESARLAMLQAPPKFRNEHLTAIHDHVRRLRHDADRRRLAALPPDPAELGECADCGDSGFVCVPHPRRVVAGAWDGVTAAVCCHCLKGERAHAAWQRLPETAKDRIKAPPMTWAEYQRTVPRWRVLLAEGERRREQERRARAATDAADLAGPIGRVLERAGVP